MMSNTPIQAVACTIHTQSVLRECSLYALAFPEEWFEPLRLLQEERSGRRDKPNMIPIRSINATLRAFVPSLLTVPYAVRPTEHVDQQQEEQDGSGEVREVRHWLLAKQPIPIDHLWRVIQAWLEQTYSMCESFSEVLPLLQKEDLQWMPFSFRLESHRSENGTARLPRLAYRAIPALLADLLVEREASLPVGQASRYLVRVPTEEGAELMTWPPVFVLKRKKKWGFSYTVKITLQTIVGQSEPRVHFHYGIRRWQSDTCYDGQTFYLRGKTSVYLRPTRSMYDLPLPGTFTVGHIKGRRQNEIRIPVWGNLLPQIARRLGVPLPSAEQLTSRPKDWLDGKDGVEAGIVYTTPRYHPIGTGIGHDVCEDFTQCLVGKLSSDLLLLPPFQPYRIPAKVEAHPLTKDFLEIAPEKRLEALVASVGKEVTIEVYWQTEAVRDMLVDRVLAVLTRTRPQLMEGWEHEENLSPEEPSLEEFEELLEGADEEDVTEEEIADIEDEFFSAQELIHTEDPPKKRHQSRKRAPEPPPPPAKDEEIIDLPGGGRLRVITRPLGSLSSPLFVPDSEQTFDARIATNQRANNVVEMVEQAQEPTLTLIELPNYRDLQVRRSLRGRDPKHALRLGMAKRGRVTQFITNKVDESLRARCKSAVLDGLRQLGYLPEAIAFEMKRLTIPSPLLVVGIWFVRMTRKRAAVGIHLPIVVLLSTAEQKIYAWLPHDQRIRLYREALLEMVQLHPEQVKKRKRQEALGQLRQFLLGDLLKLGTSDVVAFVSAQNARSTWQGLYNNAVPFDGLRFEADENSPQVRADKLPIRLRLVRLRTNLRGEMPEWFIPGAKPSETAQGLWIESGADPKNNRIFYNIAGKPNTAPKKAYQGKQQNPRETYRISSVVEVMPLIVHEVDDAALWAVAVDQWRRMSFLTNDMTLFPLPLALAQKMGEYAEVIGPWVFPEEWGNEEEIEGDEDDLEILPD